MKIPVRTLPAEEVMLPAEEVMLPAEEVMLRIFFSILPK